MYGRSFNGGRGQASGLGRRDVMGREVSRSVAVGSWI